MFSGSKSNQKTIMKITRSTPVSIVYPRDHPYFAEIKAQEDAQAFELWIEQNLPNMKKVPKKRNASVESTSSSSSDEPQQHQETPPPTHFRC